MPKRKLPPNDELRRLYESGNSSGEIASQFNVKPVTVISGLNRIPGFKMRSNSEAQKLAFAHGKKPALFWKGKKQPKAMVERRISKIRGKNHWLWKGGFEKRDYRKVITKESCSKCGSRLNLCIHHEDFDHYNNSPGNLKVLCVSCHLSLHKKHYWDCKRRGIEHKVSTKRHHWRTRP